MRTATSLKIISEFIKTESEYFQVRTLTRVYAYPNSSIGRDNRVERKNIK